MKYRARVYIAVQQGLRYFNGGPLVPLMSRHVQVNKA